MPAKEATPFSLELDRRVEEGALGTLYEKLPDDQVRCYACAHRRLIKDGLRRSPPAGVAATGAVGREQLIKWVVRHQYEGEIVSVSARVLAPFNVTPDHRVLATQLPGHSPATYVSAGQLSASHFLAVPRRFE